MCPLIHIHAWYITVIKGVAQTCQSRKEAHSISISSYRAGTHTSVSLHFAMEQALFPCLRMIVSMLLQGRGHLEIEQAWLSSWEDGRSGGHKLEDPLWLLMSWLQIIFLIASAAMLGKWCESIWAELGRRRPHSSAPASFLGNVGCNWVQHKQILAALALELGYSWPSPAEDVRREVETEVNRKTSLKPPAGFLSSVKCSASMQKESSKVAGFDSSQSPFCLDRNSDEQNTRL